MVVMVTLEAEADAEAERCWPGNFGAMRRVCVFSSAAVAVEYAAAAAAAAGKQAGSVSLIVCATTHIYRVDQNREE